MPTVSPSLPAYTTIAWTSLSATDCSHHVGTSIPRGACPAALQPGAIRGVCRLYGNAVRHLGRHSAFGRGVQQRLHLRFGTVETCAAKSRRSPVCIVSGARKRESLVKAAACAVA